MLSFVLTTEWYFRIFGNAKKVVVLRVEHTTYGAGGGGRTS